MQRGHKASERETTFNIKHDTSSKFPFVEEIVKDGKEYDLIFKKFDIPWLSNQGSTLQGEGHIDSEIENLKKTLEQHKSQICFLNDSNDILVMTNIRLREDLDNINTHYQELIVVSKEALKRKREIQSRAKGLNRKIQNLSQQNEVLLNRIRRLETKQERSKKKYHALEGINMLS